MISLHIKWKNSLITRRRHFKGMCDVHTHKHIQELRGIDTHSWLYANQVYFSQRTGHIQVFFLLGWRALFIYMGMHLERCNLHIRKYTHIMNPLNSRSVRIFKGVLDPHCGMYLTLTSAQLPSTPLVSATEFICFLSRSLRFYLSGILHE